MRRSLESVTKQPRQPPCRRDCNEVVQVERGGLNQEELRNEEITWDDWEATGGIFQTPPAGNGTGLVWPKQEQFKDTSVVSPPKCETQVRGAVG